MWLEVAKLGNAYYPELMGCWCIINGPSAAAWAVRTINRYLDRDTASKIELHSPGVTPAAVSKHLGDESKVPPELLR